LARNQENYVALDQAGALAVMLEVVPNFIADAEFCEAAVGVIRNFADPNDFAAKLGDMGACELLVSILQAHKDNKEVLENGLGAIINLSVGNISNKIKLGDAGACELLVHVLRAFAKDPVIAFMATSSIGNLSHEVVDLRAKLNALGAAKAVKSSCLSRSHVSQVLRILTQVGPIAVVPAQAGFSM
jgi:hypothetical protein